MRPKSFLPKHTKTLSPQLGTKLKRKGKQILWKKKKCLHNNFCFVFFFFLLFFFYVSFVVVVVFFFFFFSLIHIGFLCSSLCSSIIFFYIGFFFVTSHLVFFFPHLNWVSMFIFISPLFLFNKVPIYTQIFNKNLMCYFFFFI